MKQPVLILFLSILSIILISCLSGLPGLYAQEKSDEKIEGSGEYVEVVNIQMIVRALRKGKPVSGLKESDFTLYENGKPLPITSLTEVRRKVGINSPPATETAETDPQSTTTPSEATIPAQKRLFLLYLWVSEEDKHIYDALDFFFDQVYRDGDYILLAIRNEVYTITRKTQLEATLIKVKSRLRKLSRLETQERDRMTQRLEDIFRRFKQEFAFNETRDADQEALIDRLLYEYRGTWQAYKSQNITFNSRILTGIAESLKHLDFEKWGVVFYQHDTFPKWNPESITIQDERSRRVMEKMKSEFRFTEREMERTSRSVEFMEKIQQAFIDANATFHLMLSNTKSSGKLSSIFLRTSNIFSDWQQAFRNISQATGGEVIDAGMVKESLSKAVEKEDIYYRLTYAPKAGGSNLRKIEIKPKDKKLKCFYHRKILFRQAEAVTIEDVSFTHPQLDFTLRNYRQFFDGTRLHGDLDLKITGIDSRGEQLTSNRVLAPDTDATTIGMKLNFPGSGDYSLIIEALDRQTGKTAVFSRKITIPNEVTEPGEPVLITELPKAGTAITGDITLASILERSADYCETVKKATFYFLCTEEVRDSYFIRGQQVKNERYLYDYQIVMEENGKMNETRDLKSASFTDGSKIDNDRENGKKNKKKKRKRKSKKKKSKNHENPLVVTAFFSKYPYLLPVEILAKENQHKYRYRLLGTETVVDKETMLNLDAYKIAVGIKQKNKKNGRRFFVHYAVVWIDPSDGSVLKIQLDSHFVRGIEQLKQVARKKQKRLKITDIHWYEVKRSGVRFPSRTEINGLFLAKNVNPQQNMPQEALVSEHVRTTFGYQEYLFFKVNTEVTDSGHDDTN